jgi:hypothetical protein
MKLIDLEFNLRKHELKRDLRLSKAVYIQSVAYAVESLLKVLKSQSGKRAYLPYYNTLFNIYQKLEDEKNKKGNY